MTVIRVGLADLKPGHTLADDLCDIRGRLIIKSGTTLTEKNLRLIKTWGIMSAMIEDPQGTGKNDLFSEEDEQLIQNLLDDRFSLWNRDIPLHAKLIHGFRLRAEKILSQKGKAALNPFFPPKIEEQQESVQSPLLQDDLNFDHLALPSLPSVLIQLNDAINNPHCTATHISEVVCRDVSLTARLLRLVNSSMYGFPSRIDSIPRAVTIIGPRQLVSLAIGTSVIAMFSGIPKNILDVEEFWKHSIATGIIARSIMSFKNSFETESVFIAGLLHDIGKLILFTKFPELSKVIVEETLASKCRFQEIEMKHAGTTHGELGARLIQEWGLPPHLATCCRFHHTPNRDGIIDLPLVVNMADDMANALGYGLSGEPIIPLSSEETWHRTGLTIDIIDNILEQIDLCFEDTVAGFLSEP